MQELTGKVAFVTGAASGIGQATAALMGERGATVVVTDINDAGMKETAAMVAKAGGRCRTRHLDVSSMGELEAAVRETEAEFGQIDILVNNAGINHHATIDKIEGDDFDRMFTVHVKSAFMLTKFIVPGMKARRSGKIVNTASMWGMQGAHHASHYCAAKAALMGATKAWAREFAPYNIQVNAVAPGRTLTGMSRTVQTAEMREWQAQNLVPLKRWCESVEIGYTIAFLASSDADFITGQTVSPNGGEAIIGY